MMVALFIVFFVFLTPTVFFTVLVYNLFKKKVEWKPAATIVSVQYYCSNRHVMTTRRTYFRGKLTTFTRCDTCNSLWDNSKEDSRDSHSDNKYLSQ